MHGSSWSFVGVVAPRLMSDGTDSGAGGGKAGGSFSGGGCGSGCDCGDC